MRVCCLGDIHYHGVRRDLERLARNIEGMCFEADVVVIVGDITSSGRLEYSEEVLSVVKEVVDPAPLLVIPGNHDIYLSEHERASGINSLLKLSMFNELAERLGCIALMKKPYIIDGVGFVGSIGWYDYSFAPEWLNFPLDAYREKSFGLYIWADREFIKLPMSDEDFTLMLLNKFEEDIKSIYSNVEKIVAVLHHLPFRKLVKYRLEPSWDFFSAYMGSENFGYIIKKYSDKVELTLFGHQHDGVETSTCRGVEGIRCCNCASPLPTVVEL